MVVLVYVGLDLCLPHMPGAFEFDPAGTVDSVDSARGRLAAGPVVLAARSGESSLFPPQPPTRLSDGQPRNPEAVAPWRPAVTRLPRATVAPSPPSEDPH